MTEFDFVDNIKAQSIFKKWFGRSPVLNASGGNLLAVNANKDLFVAIENTIRCCTINSKSSNYKILVSNNTPFDIKEIGLNPSGRLIYSTDFYDVIVQDFPSDINNSKAVNKSSLDVKLKGLEGKIKKIAWCAYGVNQMSIAILQEGNIVSLYDLNTGESPVLRVKLSDIELFKDEIATSITFGSSANVQGGLTLYISTKSAQIYAIYPFTGKEIWVTREEVEIALTDTSGALIYLKNNYEGSDIEDVLKPVHLQIDYFKRIYSQMNSHTWFGTKLVNGKSVEAYKINCPISDTPKVLGPLSSLAMDTISDIQGVGENDQCSLLVAVGAGETELKVEYLTQISPLIMSWPKEAPTSSPSMVLPPPNQPVNSPEKHLGYKKPQVGFGYIEDEDDDDEDDEPATPDSLSAIEDGSILHLWDTINRLDTVAFDVLSDVSLSTDCKIIPSSVDSSQFLIYSPSKTVYCKPNGWTYQLPDIRGLDIKNSYDLIDNGKKSKSVGLITDDITFTGDYLIAHDDYLNNDDSTGEIKVIQINEPPQQRESTSIKSKPVEKAIIKSKLDTSLLTEIEHDLMKLGQKRSLSQKISSQDTKVEILDKINKFSVESIDQINSFDTLLMKLNLKVAANLIELNYQVSTYNQMNPKNHTQNNTDKLNALKVRQETLHKRLSQLHTKLAVQVEEIKVNNQTPLSKAEKEWFNEINAITNKVNKPDSDLPKLLEDLRAQVDYIKENRAKPSDSLVINQVKEIKKIKSELSSQYNDLVSLKDQVDELTNKLEESI